MICPSCGNAFSNEHRFCPLCGEPVRSLPYEAWSAPSGNGIAPGFSDKINDPSLRRALQQGSKGALIFAVPMILAPVVVALILSIKDGDFSYLSIGGAVSLLFLLFNLVSAAKKKCEKQWDGIVIEKTTRRIRSRNGDSDETFTQYILVFREDGGKKRRLKEGTSSNEAHPYYNYLQVGDRVRCHPEFNCFYEKYDKTKDTYIYCALCGAVNDIMDDTCAACGVVLVK